MINLERFQRIENDFILSPYDTNAMEDKIKTLKEELNNPEVYGDVNLYVNKSRELNSLLLKNRLYTDILSSVELIKEATNKNLSLIMKIL